MPDLDMSPYAAFVWPAWAISALALSAVVARAVMTARRWKTELARLEAGTDPAQDADPTAPKGSAQVAQSAVAATNTPPKSTP